MGRHVVYKCDDSGCNQEWTPTNHWFQVGPMEDTFRAEGEAFPPGLEVIPFNPAHWSDDFPETDRVFCGITHTLVYLSKELQKMHEPAVAPATMGLGVQAGTEHVNVAEQLAEEADAEWNNRAAHGAGWRTDETGTV